MGFGDVKTIKTRTEILKNIAKVNLDLKTKEIQNQLKRDLIKNIRLSSDLYEYELAETVDFLKNSMNRDDNDYILSLTVNSGDTALVLILRDQQVLINEAALEQLRSWWPERFFKKNFDIIISDAASQLANDELPYYGFTQV